MTKTTEKALTVSLTAVLVVSILAATAGFVGTAAAASVSYSEASVSQGPIFSGSTVNGTMTVSNSGDSGGTYNVSLSVDGSVEQWANGTIGSDKEKDVTINETLWEVGDRTVTVSDVSGGVSATETVTVENANAKYHGGPENLGHYPDQTGPKSQPEEVWSISDGAVPHVMQSTIVNGTLYTAFHDGGNLYALDPETGAEEWNATPGGGSGSTWSTPAYADGVLYLGSNDYKLHAIDATDGSELWHYDTQTNVRSAPAVVDGVVYFGSNDGNMTAVNATTGEEIWHHTLYQPVLVESNPAVVDGVVYFASNADNVTALDAETGERLWNTSIRDKSQSDPTVANDTVFIGVDSNMGETSGTGQVLALNATDGTERWHYNVSGDVDAGVVYADGIVYAGSRGGNLTALDESDGSKIWNVTGSDFRGAPVVAGDVLYISDYGNASVHAFDAADGTELWSYESPTGNMYPTPLAWDGYLYYGSGSHFYALEQPAPAISDVNATNPSSQDVQVSFDSDTELDTISVSISGAESATLTEDDFTESGSSGSYTYTATYGGSSDGTYTATVDTAEDADGNDGASGESDSVTVDTKAPTFDDASNINSTTIDVDISDDGTGIDESSIDKSDFSLSTGTIASLDTSGVTDGETGTQTVALTLDSAVDAETVDVSIVGSIDDKDGNSLSSGTETVSDMDGVAPTFDDASKVDDTTIEVTITDGVDVDESSIDKSDFSLSEGSIASLDASENGSDADVTITLDSAVGASSVDVSIEGSIEDASGNSLTSGTETVTNMDGIAPTISSFDVSNPSGSDIRITLESDEQLDAIDVIIADAESATLNAGDFDESGSGPYTYNATYSGSTGGEYNATLETAEDDAGNDGSSGQSESVTIDTGEAIFQRTKLSVSPEEITVNDSVAVSVDIENVGDETGTYGLAATVDGERETVEVGESLAPGESVRDSVRLTFDEPGTFDVGIIGVRDDPRTQTVTVTEPSANLSVTDYDLNETNLTVGESLAIEATVSNTGDAAGTLDVPFLVDDETVDNETVAVEANTTETVAFEWIADESGEVIVTVDDLEPTSVAVVTDSADLSIADYELSETRVKVTRSLTATATVTNDGDAAGNLTVPLVVDGETVAEETVEVPANDSKKATVEWTAESTGNYSVAVGDLETRTVSVREWIVPDFADEETGVVEPSGLRLAIDLWREGTISTELLRDVIDVWRTGEIVT